MFVDKEEPCELKIDICSRKHVEIFLSMFVEECDVEM